MELRMPEKVGVEEWSRKADRVGRLKFTEEEIGFFGKFTEVNKEFLTTLHNEYEPVGPNFFISNEYYHDEDFTLHNMKYMSSKIFKLDDDWYLIRYESRNGLSTTTKREFYICDEWEEVLGYLSTNHNFKI